MSNNEFTFLIIGYILGMIITFYICARFYDQGKEHGKELGKIEYQTELLKQYNSGESPNDRYY